MEFLPLIAIALVFWLLILRPASKRQKAVAQLQASLKPGDRVLLSSGLYATLLETLDDRVRAEIADGVVVEVARGAVAAVEPERSPEETGRDGRPENGPDGGPNGGPDEASA